MSEQAIWVICCTGRQNDFAMLWTGGDSNVYGRSLESFCYYENKNKNKNKNLKLLVIDPSFRTNIKCKELNTFIAQIPKLNENNEIRIWAHFGNKNALSDYDEDWNKLLSRNFTTVPKENRAAYSIGCQTEDSWSTALLKQREVIKKLFSSEYSAENKASIFSELGKKLTKLLDGAIIAKTFLSPLRKIECWARNLQILCKTFELVINDEKIFDEEKELFTEQTKADDEYKKFASIFQAEESKRAGVVIDLLKSELGNNGVSEECSKLITKWVETGQKFDGNNERPCSPVLFEWLKDLMRLISEIGLAVPNYNEESENV